MNISSVEEYIGYTVASQLMKKAYGDGMEYELVFQAVFEQMQNSKSKITDNASVNTINTVGSAVSLDSLPLIKVGDNIKTYGKTPVTYNLNDLSSVGVTINNTNVSTGNIYSSNISGENVAMDEIYSAVNKYSELYDVDSNLILAIIKAESNFDSNATSPVGAKGLMQVMDFNLEAYGVINAYDVDENIRAGVSLLKSYLDDCYGDISMALMAYNAGPGTMLNRGVTSADELYKMPAETQNYVPKVLNYYKEFSN